MTTSDLPPTTFVVLGLLSKHPGSGYDLVAFAERSVAYFWPITRSQVYTELARLEALGYASSTAVAQERYPDKRVYEPTPAGLDALRAWLEDPRLKPTRTKNAVLLRTFFGAFTSPGRTRAVLAEYRARAEQQRQELAEIAQHLHTEGLTTGRLFGLATVRYGILQAEADIAWTQEAEALLEQVQSASNAAPSPGPLRDHGR